LPADRIISPRFLTISPKTGQPTFVVVHAKIARGAFASWMIRGRIDDVTKLQNFDEIGYIYSDELSTRAVPVFVCQTFGGLGLSVRLT
ncbi:peroxide stress protein YaaA, partial [Candidatus Saccharibacteria bacterium]|nr:peroxide stress protein YaaA [Candidatus Saccharibacteria bacterium]